MISKLDVTLEDHREFGLKLKKINECIMHYSVVIACLTTNGVVKKIKINRVGFFISRLRYNVFETILYKQYPEAENKLEIYSPQIVEEDKIYNKYEWNRQYESLLMKHPSRKVRLEFMVTIAPDIAKDLREFSEYINMVCNRMGPAMNKKNMAEAEEAMKILEEIAVYIETLSLPPTEQ